MIPASDNAERFRDHDVLLRAGLNHIEQGITVFDRELCLVAWNRRFFELLEFPDDLAVVGTPFSAFMRYNAERGEYGDGDVEQLTAERVELARRFTSHYIERTRPNGRIVSVRGEPLPEGGFVTVYTDITDLRRNEQLLSERSHQLEERVHKRTAELIEANKKLRKEIESRKRFEAALAQAKKMESVGRLAGGLAHDFNNILTIIIGNLDSLRKNFEDWDEIMQFIEPATRAARRGADTTRQLLSFARQQPLRPIAVDVKSLVEHMVTLLRHSMGSIETAVATRAARMPLLAQVDPHMLENALMNLAINARDAMPDSGQLKFEIELSRENGDRLLDAPVAAGDYVQISVRDTGSGIDPDLVPHVFEPFVTTKDAQSGSGLGLSMVYGFVKQSHGYIRIESDPGKGTCVILLLPVAEGDVETGEVIAGTRERIKSDGELVLLVEDDEDVRSVVRRQLTDQGYLVVEAPDGQSAKRLVDTLQDVAIVVSDIMMPGGVNGLEVANYTRERRPNIRVVLITGFADWAGFPDAGDPAFPVLKKPFGQSELLDAIAESPNGAGA